MKRKYFTVKEKGLGSLPLTFAPFLIIVPLIFMCLTFFLVQSLREQVQDALVASNLAGALIDTDEFGKTNKVIINDSAQSYNNFCTALKKNMKLDNNWVPINSNSIITSEVKVVDYYIYNVNGSKVSVNYIIQNGTASGTVEEQNTGSIVSPNGVTISETSIYSKISFRSEFFFDAMTNPGNELSTVENCVSITKD